jgi:hypothetical protein
LTLSASLSGLFLLCGSVANLPASPLLHTADASLSPAAAAPSLLSAANSAPSETAGSSNSPSKLLCDTDAQLPPGSTATFPPPVPAHPPKISSAARSASETFPAAPAMTTPPRSKTAVGRAASSTLPAAKLCSTRVVLSPTFRTPAVPAPLWAPRSPRRAKIPLSPISPASSTPAVAKLPPNPVCTAAPVRGLPGTRASRAPPANSAKPNPASSAPFALVSHRFFSLDHLIAHPCHPETHPTCPKRFARRVSIADRRFRLLSDGPQRSVQATTCAFRSKVRRAECLADACASPAPFRITTSLLSYFF